MKNVYYPLAGMNYIIDSIPQILKNKHPEDKKEIILYLSAQVNSYPHIGTLVNFISAFALAKQIKSTYNVPTKIRVELLESVTGKEEIINGVKYYKNLMNVVDKDGTTICEKYLPYFKEILNRLSTMDGIEYEIMFFYDYQKQTLVRKSLLEVLDNANILGEVLNPKDGSIRLRFECPKCGLVDKHNHNLKVIHKSKDKIILENECPIHGKHRLTVTENNEERFDMNVPLRYLVKAMYLIKSDKQNNTLSVIVDGGDWSGMWPLRVYMEPLLKLGYREPVNVIYTPTILDWSGSKLSKRMYVGNAAYREYMKEGLINYSEFYNQYGEIGFKRIYDEINLWVTDPKLFIRDYTIEYIDMILKGENIN